MPRTVETVGQITLGTLLGFTGTAHLTFARAEFRAQVPAWLPVDENVVVVASGVVELCLAVALLAAWRQPARGVVGVVTAAFFVAILPGNIAQFTEHRDAFGLDTDRKRQLRLLGQPLLVAWALWSTRTVR